MRIENEQGANLDLSGSALLQQALPVPCDVHKKIGCQDVRASWSCANVQGTLVYHGHELNCHPNSTKNTDRRTSTCTFPFVGTFLGKIRQAVCVTVRCTFARQRAVAFLINECAHILA